MISALKTQRRKQLINLKAENREPVAGRQCQEKPERKCDSDWILEDMGEFARVVMEGMIIPGRTNCRSKSMEM